MKFLLASCCVPFVLSWGLVVGCGGSGSSESGGEPPPGCNAECQATCNEYCATVVAHQCGETLESCTSECAEDSEGEARSGCLPEHLSWIECLTAVDPFFCRAGSADYDVNAACTVSIDALIACDGGGTTTTGGI